MGFNLRGHFLFSDLRQEVEVGYWAVVFEVVLVKCRFFKDRRDNSLLKPVRNLSAGGDGRRLRGRTREATLVDYCTERGWRPLSTIVFFIQNITTI